VRYGDLRITRETCRFVESERVFPDQEIVGTTWKYVNKNGGPDRRFRDNPQFPIVIYEELHIKTPGGLDEVYQFSKEGIATQLAEAIKDLGRVLVLTRFWAAVAAANNLQRKEEGVWCRYVHDTDISVRIASIRNESFVGKMAQIRTSCDGPSSKRECALIIDALIGTVLLDWRGLTHQEQPFVFSTDNARILLSQSVELLAFVTEQAVKLAASPEVGQSDPTNQPLPKIVDITMLPDETPASVTDEDEELVEKCIEIIRQEKRASTSLLQRRLRLGYTRAARIVDILEQRGILGPGEGAKPREILVDLDATV
jgi:hypothetical protein